MTESTSFTTYEGYQDRPAARFSARARTRRIAGTQETVQRDRPHWRENQFSKGSTVTHLAILIDQRRALAAQVAGLDIQIAMAVGDRDAAQRALREMEAQTIARKAVRDSGCYFDMQGEADALALTGVAHA